MRKPRASAVLWMVITCALISALPAMGEEVRQPPKPIAEMSGSAARIDWLPASDAESLALTVAGPDDFYVRREFESGETPSLSLFDTKGERLPDGTYTYELRVVPRVAADIREKLARTREAGDEYAVRELQRRGKLPERPVVQSGYFSVIGGSFANQGEENYSSSHSSSKPRTPNLVTAADQVISDDLIVTGITCLGIDCANGEVFQSSPLKLKENSIRIAFEDTSTASGFPSNDWRIVINDSQSGGANRFSIEDIDGAKTPLTIRAGAPSNSLYVTDSGQLGLGTSTPAAPLHIYGGATADAWIGMGPDPASGPAFNFGYGGGSFGRGAAFLNARPDASAVAPNPSLRFLTANVERMIITNAGRVGIGTSSPGARLEVTGGEVRFPPGAGAAGFTHFNWEGDGRNYIRGTTLIADNAGSVGIGTSTPTSKLHVNGGDIRVSGGSFIDDGVTLNAPDYVFEPSYKLMPLHELREFVAQEKHLPNIPGAAEIKEQGVNLSQLQMRLLEKIEELTLYTLAQHEQIQAQQTRITELRNENAELDARLAALEKVATPAAGEEQP